MTDRDQLILAIRMIFRDREFSLPALTEAIVKAPILNRYWVPIYGTTSPSGLNKITRGKLLADIERASNNGVPVRSTNGSRRLNTAKSARVTKVSTKEAADQLRQEMLAILQ